MNQQQITNEQMFDLSVAFKTAAGNPATIVGVPVWAIDNSAVATIEVAADGLSAVVTSGDPGQAVISVTAQTQSGASVVGEFDVFVVRAEAGLIVFNVSNIRFKPVAP
jgi:repressor of nif and glnA expression